MSGSPAPAETHRLRLAVLSRHFDPNAGGAERYSVALVQQLCQRHEIHVFAQRHAVRLDGVEHHAVPLLLRKPRWFNQLWFDLWTWWQTRRGFDVVHAHESTWHGEVQTVHVRPVGLNQFHGRTGWRLLARRLAVLTSPRLWVYLLIERARLRSGPHRAVVAVSQSLADELRHGLRSLDEGIDIVPPGVDPSFFSTPPANAAQRVATRRQLGLPAAGPLLLFVGNDHRKKGLPALLHAVAQCDPRVHLLVAGGSADVAASRRLAERLRVEGRVTFLGNVKELVPLYDAADLLVHPALEDTFGMVVAEAMSRERAVVVSRPPWCGIAGELRHREDAWLIDDPQDVPVLAATITALLADPALREALGRGGRAHVGRYAWPALAQAQEAIYRRVARR